MSEQLLNVNNEMTNLKLQINTVLHCKSKIYEISQAAKLYQTTRVASILTVVLTVYVLLSYALGGIPNANVIFMALGVIICGATIALLRDKGDYAAFSTVMILCDVALTVLMTQFLVLFLPFVIRFWVPIAITLVQWIMTVVNIYKTKDYIYKISNNI